MQTKIILGIETSCDETGAAILKKEGEKITILSNILSSSAKLQAKYGGIIPEQAAREQIKAIIPVIQESINDAPALPAGRRLTINEIDAISVTLGPGLIGSLLVGVETAKTLSLIWNKPLIPVNHLIGHFYANWIFSTPNFPCIGLLVSGGHTDLVLFKSHGKFQYLGGTRDDAAGECFDKCARLLGLPYPGGPEISKLSKNGNPKAFNLPRPMIDTTDFDFSFSGLKTAVSNLIKSDVKLGDARGGGRGGPPLSARSEARTSSGGEARQDPEQPTLSDLCASIEQAIIDPLVKKTVLAAQKYQVEQIIVAGGVASNQKLVSDLKLKIENLKLKIKLFVPKPELCTDNGAMIAVSAFFLKPVADPLKLQANPNLSLSP